MSSGWFAYAPRTSVPSSMPAQYSDPSEPTGAPDAGRPPEIADVGRLLRRGVRTVVAAARVDERTTLGSLVHDFLGEPARRTSTARSRTC